MSERTALVSGVRAEVVGPGRPSSPPVEIRFAGRDFSDDSGARRGALAWRPTPDAPLEEVLYFDRESPHRKYGAGLLHPHNVIPLDPALLAAEGVDAVGVDVDETEGTDVAEVDNDEAEGVDMGRPENADSELDPAAGGEEFDVTSPDIRHPSTMGLSLSVRLDAAGQITVRLPAARRFAWQGADDPPFPVNGRYEPCKRRWIEESGNVREAPAWRRHPAVGPGCSVSFTAGELTAGAISVKPVPLPPGSPLHLSVEAFPRPIAGEANCWLVTLVLRNVSPSGANTGKAATLYQTYFEAAVENGCLEKYPESHRPFAQLDEEEQSLALLYRESATWAIGHGCAAAWDSEPGGHPSVVYADVLPAVETPSMTPDIRGLRGDLIQLSMRELAFLPPDGSGPGWDRLESLAAAYGDWIERRRADAVPSAMKAVAARHLERCGISLERIRSGIGRLRADPDILQAFKLANLAMLLQQIGTKQLARRELVWDGSRVRVRPDGATQSPWHVFAERQESAAVGSWRAFQMAFLLMQLEGVSDGQSPDREIVDLIWFPTGGGKTEAYLGVMAFYMFHQRLLMAREAGAVRRDGTSVLMRYTLRMLTTQQFQRAASLVCAMEFIRRRPEVHGRGVIPGGRFSVALWVGSDGAPNKIAEAVAQLGAFRSGERPGSPLVITECPWCRAAIGRFEGPMPSRMKDRQWNELRVAGIAKHGKEGPLLHCPDAECEYGQEHWEKWLPVEVIDERIYKTAPSLVIATADKFAMLAYRPAAGALFGRRIVDGEWSQVCVPPGLIVQDELHLIAGPLGTMYGLYEGVIERLCSQGVGDSLVVPKLIASTATIRGAADQTKALYARISQPSGVPKMQLFPSPGLLMGDSFFGRYAHTGDGKLMRGRLYVGVHANDYGSVLTTQVRVFAAAIAQASALKPERRDAWWSLLVFYNSLRELGGAKTLFDSDIRSRLKFLLTREGVAFDARRHLRGVEELTSRLSQAEIVEMLDRLATPYTVEDNRALDVCLASSIIEVGVDIDRLSLMGVVGQPKTTAQYIQVTGRVGRRWWDRPGLVLTIYSPAKSRDRSHFEQFHSYHRRLYERVEPTSATPFAPSAIQRGLAGALLTWARQQSSAPVNEVHAYKDAVNAAFALLRSRCEAVQLREDVHRSLKEMERIRDRLLLRWAKNPQEWEDFPPVPTGEYLMLWPGQFATRAQKDMGMEIPSSMRQVDRSAELAITQGYAIADINNPQS